MIVFDLQCVKGHCFEGWFESLEDLEAQIQAKLVNCPACNSTRIKKVPSSFAIAKRGASEPDAEMAARLVGQALHRYLHDNFENVGAGFTAEALKMHYGVSPTRNIRGVSTPQEEEVLKQEGVHFFKFGAPPTPEPSEDQED
jgi:hypothetical protein